MPRLTSFGRAREKADFTQIAPLLARVRESLSLSEKDLRFFTVHSSIDVRHAEQVRSALTLAVTTTEQADAVQRVAVTTLWLTLQILDQALDAAQAPDRRNPNGLR